MFGHEHEGGQIDSRLLASRVDASSQPLPPRVVGEQGQPMEARERQLVQIAGLVVVFDELAMWSDAAHRQQLKMPKGRIQVIRHKGFAGRALAEPVAHGGKGLDPSATGSCALYWTGSASADLRATGYASAYCQVITRRVVRSAA